ncbi:hypothetical protein WICMUC_002136 [Wickerhamomyces mucosus]|uniref:Major facilitator superfamily (MFS) profile domain-containing protein n=1 Tax=Wickerhamomyces mucosus TaxID=1378264 RepID=A0A9P8PS18_9ASCO|nr:hypothetical protein WICMUC_002136 [Wickerhamomyces mucosus]
MSNFGKFNSRTNSGSSDETDRLLITRQSIENLKRSNYDIHLVESYNDDDIDEVNHSSDSSNPFTDRFVANYWRSIYSKCNYEGQYHFDPNFKWTKSEEKSLLKKLDSKITLLACIMFVGLQIDRVNLTQAVSDNLLDDLGLSTSDYNIGNTISKICFLMAEIPSGILAKKIGPDIWIPIQMILWSIITMSQCFMYDRNTFFITRALIAILEGGFIPEMVLWLSYFFKSEELTIRLSYFWGSLAISQCFTGLLAFVLLRMRGLLGLSGWSWLFLIEGFITLLIGISSYFLMVPSAVETKSKLFPNGWFSFHEEKIIVNRILRDDPSKGDMNNRQPLTFKQLFKALLDYDLWPVYIIGFIAFIPINTVTNYLTLNLKELGFDTFTTNLLTIPYNVVHILTLMVVTKTSEYFNERSIVELSSPIWVIIPLSLLTNHQTMSKETTYLVLTFLLSQPYIHAINVSWVSRNSNSIKTRTVSAALYNMFVQAGGAIAANVYQNDDMPKYIRGNTFLLKLSIFTVGYLLFVKSYYIYRNHQKSKIWDSWTYEEKEYYIYNTKDEGNKRLDFRFSH